MGTDYHDRCRIYVMRAYCVRVLVVLYFAEAYLRNGCFVRECCSFSFVFVAFACIVALSINLDCN
jgi:hypothetical protein